MTFAQLPSKNSDGQALPIWDGRMDSIPDLLKSRREIVAANWYASASMPGDHSYAAKVNHDLKELDNIVVKEETIAQTLFVEEVVKEFTKRLLYLQGSPDVGEFERPRKILKLKKLFSGSGIERIELKIAA